LLTFILTSVKSFQPPEAQQAVVQELVSEMAYEHLASLLDLPQLMRGGETSPSVETILPYLPPDTISEQDEAQDSLQRKLRVRYFNYILSIRISLAKILFIIASTSGWPLKLTITHPTTNLAMVFLGFV
jgi:hypothetical protein